LICGPIVATFSDGHAKKSEGKPAMRYSLPDFLAHAIALEQEAAERYRELAEVMESVGNEAVAEVFRDMSRFSTLHRDDILARVDDMELPMLRSWEYRWRVPPEVGDDFDPMAMTTPQMALAYARANEIRGMTYYQEVAKAATDAHVRQLALEFAGEEISHLEALDRWMARLRLIHPAAVD